MTVIWLLTISPSKGRTGCPSFRRRSLSPAFSYPEISRRLLLKNATSNEYYNSVSHDTMPYKKCQANRSLSFRIFSTAGQRSGRRQKPERSSHILISGISPSYQNSVYRQKVFIKVRAYQHNVHTDIEPQHCDYHD